MQKMADKIKFCKPPLFIAKIADRSGNEDKYYRIHKDSIDDNYSINSDKNNESNDADEKRIAFPNQLYPSFVSDPSCSEKLIKPSTEQEDHFQCSLESDQQPKETKKKMDLDTALKHVGSFGRYQHLLAAFLWLLVSPFLGFVIYGNMLILLAPDHWCEVPELRDHDLSTLQRKQLSIPLEEVDGIVSFSHCKRYDVNFTEVLSLANNSVLEADPSWPIASCRNGWEYDFTLIYPTLISQWNWVCDEAWRTYFAYTIFWIGASVGVVVLGFMADTYGRVPVVVIGHLLCALAGIATNFVTDFAIFLVVRFFVGFVIISQSMTAYVLVMEYVGTKRRLAVSTGFLFAYPIIGCILPWVAFYLRDWKLINLATSAPLLIIPLMAKCIPESLRWMIASGKYERAKIALSRVAVVNKKVIPDGIFDTVKFSDENEEIVKKKNVLDLLKLPHLRRVFLLTNITWLLTSLCFTGGYIYAATVSDNPFLMLTVNSGLDILANALADRLADKYGRRATTVISCSLAAIAYLCSAAVSKVMMSLKCEVCQIALMIFLNFYYVRILAMDICISTVLDYGKVTSGREKKELDAHIAAIAALMVGRLTVTVGYNVNYLYAAEVYPTVVRTQALAVRQAIGSIGNFLSPQVVLLALYGKYLPLLVFGVLSATAAMAMMSLPETLNKNLPETLDDGESLAQEGRFSLSLCGKDNVKKFGCQRTVEVAYITRL